MNGCAIPRQTVELCDYWKHDIVVQDCMFIRFYKGQDIFTVRVTGVGDVKGIGLDPLYRFVLFGTGRLTATITNDRFRMSCDLPVKPWFPELDNFKRGMYV